MCLFLIASEKASWNFLIMVLEKSWNILEFLAIKSVRTLEWVNTDCLYIIDKGLLGDESALTCVAALFHLLVNTLSYRSGRENRKKLKLLINQNN